MATSKKTFIWPQIYIIFVYEPCLAYWGEVALDLERFKSVEVAASTWSEDNLHK